MFTLSSEDLDRAQIKLQKLYNDAVLSAPFEMRPETQTHFYQTLERGVRIAMLASKGMNIFTFSPDIRHALGKTKLGDVRIGDVNVPFSNFYLGFEKGSGIYFGSEEDQRRWVVDGAYINVMASGENHSWNICLTSRNPAGIVTPGYTEHWPLQEEPHFTFELAGESNATFDEALGEAIESGNLDLEPDLESVENFQKVVTEIQENGISDGIEYSTPLMSSNERLA